MNAAGESINLNYDTKKILQLVILEIFGILKDALVWTRLATVLEVIVGSTKKS